MKKHPYTQHILGATYHSRYWGQNYTVERFEGDQYVTVLWADGHRTTHCTHVERDPVISLPAQ